MVTGMDQDNARNLDRIARSLGRIEAGQRELAAAAGQLVTLVRDFLAPRNYAGDRIPYVGSGADGARRSAQIDREEIDGLDLDDPRTGELALSAAEWDAQAARLQIAENGPHLQVDFQGAEVTQIRHVNSPRVGESHPASECRPGCTFWRGEPR